MQRKIFRWNNYINFYFTYFSAFEKLSNQEKNKTYKKKIVDQTQYKIKFIENSFWDV